MKFLYVFENGRLVGLQDVSGWTVRAAYKAMMALSMVGRTGELSDHGRGVCMDCHADLGERPRLKAGQLTHGYCLPCQLSAMRDILSWDGQNYA